MTRRPRPYLALLPPTLEPAAAREVLARSQRVLTRTVVAGGAVVGVLAGLVDEPAPVYAAVAVLLLATVVGAQLAGRVRARAGVVLLSDEEWDLALAVQGARLDGRLHDDVVPPLTALCDAVREGDAAATARATADLRALAQAAGPVP